MSIYLTVSFKPLIEGGYSHPNCFLVPRTMDSHNMEQESIPVECVPLACQPYVFQWILLDVSTSGVGGWGVG